MYTYLYSIKIMVILTYDMYILTHNNRNFKIARRDKKAFHSDQCKEVEENNRMGKTRDLLKKMELSRENFMHNGHNKG